MQRIGCCKGNRSFSDESQTHNKVGRAGFSFFFRKLFLEEKGCQSDGTGRCHTANHNRCHNVIISCRDGRRAEHICRFVERAAHINGHHAAQDQSEDDFARSAHAGQSVVQRRIEAAHHRFYQKGHDQAHDQKSNQRVDQYRSDLFQKIGQFITDSAQHYDRITRQETGRQCAQKTGLSAGSDHAAHKSKGQRRSVTDGHGDEARQYRKHKAECRIPQPFEPCGRRRDRTEIRSLRHIKCIHIHAQTVDQKGDRDQDTAAHHERKHMRNAVHQLRVDLVSRTAAFPGSLSRRPCSGRCYVNRHIAANSAVQKLPCLADPVRNLTLDNLLAGKTIHGHLRVGRDNDAVSLFNFFRRKDIFGSSGTSCLDLDKAVSLFCRLLDSFRRHIGVGNPGRAGGHRQNLHLIRICRTGIRQPLVYAGLLIVRLVDDRQKFLHRRGITQTVGKVLIHHQYGQLTQYVQMYVIFCIRRRDQKDQRHRFTVQRVKVHAVFYYHRRQAGACHRITFAVGNRYAFPDSGGTLFLSRIHLSAVRFLVIDPAASHHQLNDLIQRLFLVRRRSGKRNASLIQKFCNSHRTTPPIFPVFPLPLLPVIRLLFFY